MPLNEQTKNLAEDTIPSAKTLIEQSYKEASGYDLRKGSAIYTMFVQRLSEYLQPIIDFISNILGALNTNLSSTYTTFYDILASVYLDSRDSGGKATGDVIIGFDSPRLVEIPAGGVVFTNSGLQFIVSRRYTFASSQLTLKNGKYYTPNITVTASLEGAKYEIGANEISGTLMTLDGMVDIFNPSDFTGGSEKESNDSLIKRLRDSVSSRTLSNVPGIRYVLNKNYTSSIHSIEIVKTGDSEMKRDIIYAQTADGAVPFDRVDFARKVYNSTSEERSKGFYTFSSSLSPAISVDANNVANLQGFNTELSQEEYNAIGGLDSNVLEYGADKILSENWVRSATTSDVSPWFVGETNGGSLRRYADFVSIQNGRLILGSQAVQENIATVNYMIRQSISVVQDFFKNTLNRTQNARLKRALNQAVQNFGPTQSRMDDPAVEDRVDRGLLNRGEVGTSEPVFTDFNNYIDSVISDELVHNPSFNSSVSRANVSPVVQYPLPQQRGIVIKGDFIIVDDDKTAPRPLYITNFRTNNDNPRAHDGYGIAVMPNLEAGKPNLFITDNNALSDDLVLAGPMIFGGGLYENYMKGTNVTVNVNVKYKYELIYGIPQSGEADAVTLEVRVWSAAGQRPVNPTLSYGAYVPMNLRAKNIKGVAQNIEATDFGFGILQTNGFSWSVGPVSVLQAASVYSQILFMMDTSNFTGETVELLVGHNGTGSNSGAQANGSVVKIIDFNTPNSPVWEDVATNTTGAMALSRKSFDVDRYSDAADYMFVLISSKYPYDAITDINSVVETDYIAINKKFAGYNVGSKVDVYIQKKSSSWAPESEHYVDFTNISGNISLSASNGFKLPITKIENVEILDGSGAPTSQYLTAYKEYRMMSVVPEEDGSVKENKVLLLSNFAHVYNLRVRYKYIPEFDTMQSYIDSQSAAASRTDILLKHPQIKYITISFNASYSGQDLIDAIKDYVYNAVSSVRAFDITALAVQYGAQSGAVTNMNIQSEYYDSDGNLNTESNSNEITKTRVQVFVPKTITIT